MGYIIEVGVLGFMAIGAYWLLQFTPKINKWAEVGFAIEKIRLAIITRYAEKKGVDLSDEDVDEPLLGSSEQIFKEAKVDFFKNDKK